MYIQGSNLEPPASWLTEELPIGAITQLAAPFPPLSSRWGMAAISFMYCTAHMHYIHAFKRLSAQTQEVLTLAIHIYATHNDMKGLSLQNSLTEMLLTIQGIFTISKIH